jgi:hypothetical protein
MATVGYVSGGYLVVLPQPRNDAWMTRDLLPPVLLSASSCIVPAIPDTWALSWTNETPEEREQAAARFGLGADRLAAVLAWTTAAFNRGEIGWPNIFFTADEARAFVQAFVPDPSSVALLGLGLPADLVPGFLAATTPSPSGPQYAPTGGSGVYAAVLRGNAPDPGGTPLGFEILGYEHGAFHSSVCNGLERTFRDVLGVVPNAQGFYTREDEARRCAALAADPATAAEPAHWLPWEITRC